MFSFLVLLAEGAAPPAGGGGGGLFDNPILFLLPIGVVLFYMIVLRPGQRAEKERQALLSNPKKNDKVITSSGIYGSIASVSEKDDEIVVKVDDNVRLKMTKNSIFRNLTNEATAKEAAEAAKAAKGAKTKPEPTAASSTPQPAKSVFDASPDQAAKG
jgi:preprotein translocase subunit YajC